MTKTNKSQPTKKAVYFIATKYKNRQTRVSLYTKDWKSVAKSDATDKLGYSLE
ncbi:MAG: hypothetical protein ACD_13C00146G0002 [uncultured bacterium]|nr:MAG: hypothetical protein ACD_13C00146G0002 [uncultured bacterium]KKR58268.1 MAG: hypothetical protein UT96_C0008G0009 [Candidatus Woesebacteria bacterium GW2011_GWC2_40_30]